MTHQQLSLALLSNICSEKTPEFIAVVARFLTCTIYALVIGWKLALVFLSMTPLIVLVFNVTIRVSRIDQHISLPHLSYPDGGQVQSKRTQSICVSLDHRPRSLAWYSHCDGVSRTKEGRTAVSETGRNDEDMFVSLSDPLRFAATLIKARDIGIRKGFVVGLCQAIDHICFFFALSLTFWYGPRLVRSDCLHFSPGTMFTVSVSPTRLRHTRDYLGLDGLCGKKTNCDG